MVNKIDRPNTTPTVRAICKFAVYFSVFQSFSRFSLVYEGYRRYCIITQAAQALVVRSYYYFFLSLCERSVT